MDTTMKFEVPNPEDYHISHIYGFMLPEPLTHLPDYFEPWNQLAHNLPELIMKHSVREEVRKLPELNHQRLRGYKQYRCAHLFLASITAGYVWEEGDSGVLKVLPRQVAVPFHGVSSYLGIPPIILPASNVHANCRLVDKDKGPVLSNLTATIAFSPREGSEWFFTVGAKVEFTFAPALKLIQNGLQAVISADHEAASVSLNSLSKVLDNMRADLSNMHEKLPGNIFYNNVRPFLAGWGLPGSPLPDGLIYEGVSTEPVKLNGGSAAQSSTIHCMDAILGIQHKPDKREYLTTMRTHMPPAHVQFIEAIEHGPSLRDFVLSSNDTNMQEAYNKAVSSLERFRSYHVQIAAKYIIQQAHKAKNHESLQKTGTGGTTIMPFLKDLRDTTRSATIGCGKI